MQTLRYQIRGATLADEPGLLELAGFLDSVNLPNKSDEIAPILTWSEKSFAQVIPDPADHRYTFILEDTNAGRAVATSMVLGQLGRRDAPYIYLDVREEERYSASLDQHLVHKVLQIRYSYRGPTEIGGLVSHPDYRRSTQRIGSMIAYVRFLWIAMHRDRFQDEVLAELMPPLSPDGTSHLWEALGRHFTGMSYREADRLSSQNKEFIRGLFPDGDIYASLLSERAQEVIGKVGPETRGVEKLLRRIGFRYVHRIDPFDGGPHFVAPTDEISLVAGARPFYAKFGKAGSQMALVGCSYDRSPWFRAVPASIELPDPGTLTEPALSLPHEVMDHLELTEGDPVWALTMDTR
ncbi:MAG: arginine N-succinyltransferase [Myxococcota bacterium]